MPRYGYTIYSDDPHEDELLFVRHIMQSVSRDKLSQMKGIWQGMEGRLNEKGCTLDEVDGLDKLALDSPLRPWAKSLHGLTPPFGNNPRAILAVLRVPYHEHMANVAKTVANIHYTYGNTFRGFGEDHRKWLDDNFHGR